MVHNMSLRMTCNGVTCLKTYVHIHTYAYVEYDVSICYSYQVHVTVWYGIT